MITNNQTIYVFVKQTKNEISIEIIDKYNIKKTQEEEKLIVKNENGYKIDLKDALYFMDLRILEQITPLIKGATEQYIFDLYCQKHFEIKGYPFILTYVMPTSEGDEFYQQITGDIIK